MWYHRMEKLHQCNKVSCAKLGSPTKSAYERYLFEYTPSGIFFFKRPCDQRTLPVLHFAKIVVGRRRSAPLERSGGVGGYGWRAITWPLPLM